MRFATHSAPHLRPPTSVSRVMFDVVAALMPGVVLYTLFFGSGVIINLALATGAALAAEAVMLQLRGKPLAPFLQDGSAIVTGVLIALAIPPLAPWWIPVIGAAFGIIFAKHLYGGLGYNPFNPAMAGYVVLLISFPVAMTQWPAPASLVDALPGPLQSLGIVFTGNWPQALEMDAVTSATPLDELKTGLAQGRTMAEIRAAPIFGALGGTGWQWVNIGFLLGGIYLLYRRVIRWQIPLATLGGLGLMALIFYIGDPDLYASPVFHIFNGAAILCAFFIATDPVSASTTPRGRLVYGLGIGVLIYVIRTWGGYPDAVAFAVLLMNMAVPAIDQYTRPRVYGHGKKRGSGR